MVDKNYILHEFRRTLHHCHRLKMKSLKRILSREQNFACIYLSYDVYYRTKVPTTAKPSIQWQQLMDTKNCKLRVLSNECCLDFIRQSINEIIHLASFRHCLRPSKWRVGRPAGRNFQPYDKLRYSSEPPFDVESEWHTHLIVAQRTSELQPDFTSVSPLSQLEKLIAPNFRFHKHVVTEIFAA